MFEALFIGIIIGTIGGLVFVIWNAVSGHRKRRKDDQPRLSAGTKLMLGAMGAKLLDNQIEKHKRESERKWKETLNWQDAIREKEREESGYDDDWL